MEGTLVTNNYNHTSKLRGFVTRHKSEYETNKDLHPSIHLLFYDYCTNYYTTEGFLIRHVITALQATDHYIGDHEKAP